MDKMPPCKVGPGRKSCIQFAYVSLIVAPTNATSPSGVPLAPPLPVANLTATGGDIGEAVVQQMIADQGWTAADYKKFNTVKDMQTYLLAEANGTAAAAVFRTVPEPLVTSGRWPGWQLAWDLHYNSTQTWRYGVEVLAQDTFAYPALAVIERAIARLATAQPTLPYRLTEAGYPRPALIPTDVVRTSGGIFFFGALMFNVVIQLGQIVYEKERKLREGMKVMGLTDMAYWSSWLITNLILNFISAWMLVIGGYIFQFEFFLHSSFGSFFFLFLLFAWAMVPWVFFLSVFTDKSRTAFSLGFLVFLVGFIAVAFAPFLFTKSFMEGKYGGLTWIFRWLPFMLLGKGMDDIGSLSGEDVGFTWASRTSNSYWSLADTYRWLIIDFFVIFLVTLYLDNVVKGEFGRPKPPYYFLTPAYWTGKPRADVVHAPVPADLEAKLFADKVVTVQMSDGTLQQMRLPFQTDDEGVLAEDRRVAGMSFGQEGAPSIVIKGLNMTFRKSWMCIPTGDPFYAVRKVNLSIEESKLFCLLGHNGAGKSTTINMLTGLINPTWGDAYIRGYSVRNQMGQIRSFMGVCPQHDILWDQLTGREHLEIYTNLKGIDSKEERLREVAERLHDVHLTDSADVTSGAYSGGMRRRLSTAIAFCADPRVVFLDEPTTGMDPVSRRQVWDLIERKKKGRAIILTTHSMEEADTLSDQIGIMGAGRLIALGTSLRLKNKFGSGYQLTVVLKDADDAVRVASILRDSLGMDPVPSHVPKELSYNVPKDIEDRLPRALASLTGVKGVKDVQLATASLEEVFIKVAHYGETPVMTPAPMQQQQQQYPPGADVPLRSFT